MREICLDIETTGLEPREGHKIVEIAAIELSNKVKTGNNFHTYINPRRDMPQEAFRIHGISTEFLQDKPIFEHMAQKFLDFISGARLIIHNAAFDTKFLNHELKMMNLEIIDMSLVLDSLLLARSKFPGAPASLDALCRRFNIDLSKRSKHGALLDAELLAEVYLELIGGAQTSFFDTIEGNSSSNNASWQSPSANSSIEENISPKADFTALFKREFTLSEQDLKLHQEFIINNFKNNLWGYVKKS
jgi:DNA polymerase-3 subunit epsilon